MLGVESLGEKQMQTKSDRQLARNILDKRGVLQAKPAREIDIRM